PMGSRRWTGSVAYRSLPFMRCAWASFGSVPAGSPWQSPSHFISSGCSRSPAGITDTSRIGRLRRPAHANWHLQFWVGPALNVVHSGGPATIATTILHPTPKTTCTPRHRVASSGRISDGLPRRHTLHLG